MNCKNFSIAGSAWTIASDADVLAAREIRVEMLSALDALGPDVSVTVEVSTTAPTAPVIQLAHALRRSLENRGAFAGFGPHAEAITAQ